MYCKDGLKIAFNDGNTKKSYARRTKILLFRDKKKKPKKPAVSCVTYTTKKNPACFRFQIGHTCFYLTSVITQIHKTH